MSVYISNKFSYSKLNTYESCGWKYFLTYEEGHYLYTESIQSLFGTLVHHIEENIAHSLQQNQPVDYNQLKKDFVELNIPKTSLRDTKGGIFGINILRQKFPEEFYQTDMKGNSYAIKTEKYLKTGIYRLENYLKANPDLKIYGMEQFFSMSYQDKVFSGYIDRIFYDTKNCIYIIEDIKTKDKPFRDADLEMPLQFVIYVKALSNMLNISTDRISCVYDLPILEMKQPAGSINFVAKGLLKIEKLLQDINAKDFVPHPSPLCAYCPFSGTTKEQPEEAKHLCCYYSLWTPGGSARV